MKKILNKAEDLVIEMCEGMIKAHPTQLAFNRKFKIISRAKVNKQKVSLISGGGSGHDRVQVVAALMAIDAGLERLRHAVLEKGVDDDR